jgi:Cu2+-exporting ATPase
MSDYPAQQPKHEHTDHHDTHDNHHENHQSHQDHQGHDHSHHDPSQFKQKFWLSLILTLPILYYAEQFQTWFGYDALSFPGSEWLSPVLAVVLYFYGGWVFLTGAISEIRSKQPGMMTLIAFAITVAFVYSLVVTFGFPGMPLYWELATLIDIMLLGHWFEMASVQQASGALDELASLMPSTAHRLNDNGQTENGQTENGQTEDVQVGELQQGERILVRPGEQMPADGVVVEGRSSVNEAFLTGESTPVEKAEGDEVVAGSVNSEGALTIEITETGEGTTLSQMQRLVEEAQHARGRYQRLADKAAAWLFYVAVTAGTVTFVVWIFAADTVQFAVARTVTVLVIACPHALGLAIPLVVANATALSAKHGILVRNREAFDRARQLDVIAFDKTGTLTQGVFRVADVFTADMSEEDALALAASLEHRSEHPLAQAIVSAAEDKQLEPRSVQDFETISGKGVRASVDGNRYHIGRPEWLDESSVTLADDLRASLDSAHDKGQSVIAMFDDTQVLALFALEDTPRESAKRAIAALKERGITTVMVTGDAEAVAKRVAEALGIERYHARVLPEDKANIIKDLKQQGDVAFVGDGINDAPALLAADLGVAIGAGTNVAIESADVVLVNDDPEDVLGILILARASYRKMIQNLWWAAGYNIVALPLAAGVLAGIGFFLSPAIGALLMSASTIIVAINAMLLRRTSLEPTSA